MSAECKSNPTGRNLVGVSSAKIRQIFLETITDEDIKDLTRKLIEIATEGDFRAIKFLLSYLLGKPGPEPSTEELNQAIMEEALAETKPKKWDKGLPPLTAADLMAAGRGTPNAGYGDASNIRVANQVGKGKDKRRK